MVVISSQTYGTVITVLDLEICLHHVALNEDYLLLDEYANVYYEGE